MTGLPDAPDAGLPDAPVAGLPDASVAELGAKLAWGPDHPGRPRTGKNGAAQTERHKGSLGQTDSFCPNSAAFTPAIVQAAAVAGSVIQMSVKSE